jgi:hypothetical protein
MFSRAIKRLFGQLIDDKVEVKDQPTVELLFDEKYKHIIQHNEILSGYCEISSWLNSSTTGSVDVKRTGAIYKEGTWVTDNTAPICTFIGFEKSDDYLHFKIRFAK